MSQILISKLQKRFGEFSGDEQGAVAMLFSLSFIPMIMLGGVAIDYGRAVQVRDGLRQAADAVTLSLAKSAASQTPAQLETFAARMIAATTTQHPASLVGPPTVSTDKAKVCIEAATNVDTTFMRIAGVTSVQVTVSSCATNASANFEIALVLDTSGSMNNSAGSGTKIAAVRTVSTSFVNTMFTNYPTPAGQTTPRVKFSVVPFAASVAVGSSDTNNRTASWIDTNASSSWHWKSWTPSGAASGLAAGVTVTDRFGVYNWLKTSRASYDWVGCFETPPYPYNVQDFKPTSASPDSLFVPMLAPDEPDTAGGGYSNNYLGDNPSASCKGSAPTTEAARQDRVCKYKSPNITAASSSTNGPNRACNSAPLQRLTSTQSSITTKIGALTANGSTNLHEGFSWGWRTLSPGGTFSDGVAYSEATAVIPTRKVLILMTDGMNTWPAQSNSLNGSDYGAAGFYTSSTSGSSRFPTQNSAGNTILPLTTSAGGTAALDQLTREACANARAAGVAVYTVGFESTDAISAQGKALLQECAGNDPSRFFLATNSASLNDAFVAIGKSLNSLYLSK